MHNCIVNWDDLYFVLERFNLHRKSHTKQSFCLGVSDAHNNVHVFNSISRSVKHVKSVCVCVCDCFVPQSILGIVLPSIQQTIKHLHKQAWHEKKLHTSKRTVNVFFYDIIRSTGFAPYLFTCLLCFFFLYITQEMSANCVFRHTKIYLFHFTFLPLLKATP